MFFHALLAVGQVMSIFRFQTHFRWRRLEFPEAWNLFKLNICLVGLRDECSIEGGLLRGEFTEKQ